LERDIGGASNFAALSSQGQDNGNSDNNSNVQVASSDSVQEQGGQLAVTNTNNVGAFVYPGDTVTFFEKVNNTGTGKVYGVKLNLYLIKNGQPVGGTTFDLGDIEAGHGKTLTTGFVLSKALTVFT